MYTLTETAELIGVSIHTIDTWYKHQAQAIRDGYITEEFLPKPLIEEHLSGKPRRWTPEMVEQLKAYRATIVRGRNGVMGRYSNPNHKIKKGETEDD